MLWIQQRSHVERPSRVTLKRLFGADRPYPGLEHPSLVGVTAESERLVFVRYRKADNWLLDDATWHEGPFEDPQRDREYEWLSPVCHGIVVEGEPETRDWALREEPVAS